MNIYEFIDENNIDNKIAVLTKNIFDGIDFVKIYAPQFKMQENINVYIYNYDTLGIPVQYNNDYHIEYKTDEVPYKVPNNIMQSMKRYGLISKVVDFTIQ